MAELTSLFNKRKGHLGCFGKLSSTLQEGDQHDIKGKIQQLEIAKGKIDALNDLIIDAISAIEDRDIDIELENISNNTVKQAVIIANLAARLLEVEDVTPLAHDYTPLVHKHSPTSNFHLPKINIPTFDGDILQWQAFWDLYNQAIHQNDSLLMW